MLQCHLPVFASIHFFLKKYLPFQNVLYIKNYNITLCLCGLYYLTLSTLIKEGSMTHNLFIFLVLLYLENN